MAKEKWVLNAILDPTNDCHVRWEKTRVVVVQPYDTAKIEINLSCVGGGTVIFQDTPLTWVGTDPGWTPTVNSAKNQVTFSDPNLTPGTDKVKYEFHLNWNYTDPDGTTVRGQSDPTIINEGTGMSPGARRAG
jgi:hypothetical protein